MRKHVNISTSKRGILQPLHRRHLLGREEQVDDAHPKGAYERDDHDRADKAADQAQKRALPKSERIARAQLDRLSGQKSNRHLRGDEQNHREGGEQSLRRNPGLKLIAVREKREQVLAGRQEERNGGDHDGRDDDDACDMTLVRCAFRQLISPLDLHAVRRSAAYRPRSSVLRASRLPAEGAPVTQNCRDAGTKPTLRVASIACVGSPTRHHPTQRREPAVF